MRNVTMMVIATLCGTVGVIRIDASEALKAVVASYLEIHAQLAKRGTGIGLNLVDHIVRAHRGRVDVETEVGHGSTFTVILPAVLEGAKT